MALRGMETFEIKRPVTPSTADKLPPSPNRDSFKWRSLSTDNLTDMAEKKIRRQNVLDWKPKNKHRDGIPQGLLAQKKKMSENVTPGNAQKHLFLPEDFGLDATRLEDGYNETHTDAGSPTEDNFDGMATTRQRSASLARRQKKLLAAINIDMIENNTQQEEDADFDLDLPFEINESYTADEASVAGDVGGLKIRILLLALMNLIVRT